LRRERSKLKTRNEKEEKEGNKEAIRKKGLKREN
jgi:hypothetical protein